MWCLTNDIRQNIHNLQMIILTNVLLCSGVGVLTSASLASMQVRHARFSKLRMVTSSPLRCLQRELDTLFPEHRHATARQVSRDHQYQCQGSNICVVCLTHQCDAVNMTFRITNWYKTWAVYPCLLVIRSKCTGCTSAQTVFFNVSCHGQVTVWVAQPCVPIKSVCRFWCIHKRQNRCAPLVVNCQLMYQMSSIKFRSHAWQAHVGSTDAPIACVCHHVTQKAVIPATPWF